MTIELTVGVSASGKTTYAENKVAKSKGKWINLNRDDIRKTLFCIPASSYKFTKEREDLVTKTQLATADFALSNGKSVVISDTNLDPNRWECWKQLAKKYDVQLLISYFAVDLKTATKRNLSRDRSVPESVIKAQIEKFETNFPKQVNYFVPKVYVQPENGEECWIVDIDGTLAHMNDKRGAFEWHNVGLDDPDEVVIELVNMLYSNDYKIILMSGRDEICREETERWLMLNGVNYHKLHMRPNGDMRPDTEVKEELFENNIAKYRKVVMGVLDDRNVVVSMWRKKGLKVLQVAEGDFQ